MSDLRKELASTLNRHSAENGSNTPDFILAHYLMACLDSFDAAVKRRDEWYGIKPVPGRGVLGIDATAKPASETQNGDDSTQSTVGSGG
jgi:hypothetical protein